MTMHPDIAEIARGLTEQARAILSSSWHDPRRHGPYHVYVQRPNSLQSVLALARRGLIARNEDVEGAYEFFERGKMTGYMQLTPLGRSLRDHLLSKDKNDV